MARYEVWLLAVIALRFAVREWRSAARPLWYDELLTFHIARLPDLAAIFRAIPGDGSPPLNFLLARACMKVLGPTELAVRLPAIVAFACALGAVYLFVRRRFGVVNALFAVLVLSLSGMADFAAEARPYALLLGFTGLILLCWQAATEDTRPRLVPLIGVALGVAGVIASHHYGVIYAGIALSFGEAVRLWKRRRIDFPLYAACAAGFLALAVTLPFARATRQVALVYTLASTTFWAKPQLESLLSYEQMVDWWLPVVLLALIWLTRPAFASDSAAATADSRIRPHEIAAAVGLTLLVPIIILITRVTTGYFMNRYAIGSAMGIALLAGIATPLLGRSRSHTTAVVALCVLLLLIQLFAPTAAARARSIVTRFTASPADSESASVLDAAQGRDPIVVASALAYMPLWWYSAPRLRERLHYLADLPYAVRQPDFLPELSLDVDQEFLPSKVDDYHEFLTTHTRFLLYCTGRQRLEWTKDRLTTDHWRLHLLRQRGAETLFLAEAPGL